MKLGTIKDKEHIFLKIFVHFWKQVFVRHWNETSNRISNALTMPIKFSNLLTYFEFNLLRWKSPWYIILGTMRLKYEKYLGIVDAMTKKENFLSHSPLSLTLTIILIGRNRFFMRRPIEKNSHWNLERIDVEKFVVGTLNHGSLCMIWTVGLCYLEFSLSYKTRVSHSPICWFCHISEKPSFLS